MPRRVSCRALCLFLLPLWLVAAQRPPRSRPELADTDSFGQYPSVGDVSRLVTQSIRYNDQGTRLTGYLIYDGSTDNRRPGVLILPDESGIGPHERWRASMLALMGYIAFVADMYGAEISQGPADLPEGPHRQALVDFYISSWPKWRSRVLAGLDQVRKFPLTEVDKLAAIGYGWGGGGMLELIRSWPEGTVGVQGVVAFHPTHISSQGPSALANVSIPLLLYRGREDRTANPGALSALRSELTAANASYTIVEFGMTVAGFTDPANPPWDGTPGQATGYNAEADLQSWWGMRGFLLDALGLTDRDSSYTAAQYRSDYSTGFGGEVISDFAVNSPGGRSPPRLPRVQALSTDYCC